MKHARIVCVIAAAAALTACYPDYKAATTGPTATLIEAPDMPYNQRMIFLFAGAECQNPQVATLRGGKKISVPAGVPLYLGRNFSSGGGMVSAYCASSVSFTPAEGQTYEIGWKFVFGGCQTEVTLINPDGTRAPQPVTPLLNCPRY